MNNHVAHQHVSVPFEYDVVFTDNVFGPGNDTLCSYMPGTRGPAKVVCFVDAGLAECRHGLTTSIARYFDSRPEQIEQAAPVQLVPGGEQIKNSISILDTVGELSAGAGLDRHSYIVIVGGGAVLDAVGWAAATIHRGIRQIRVPTTTLSQGDSGVGVKNGINRFGQKNYYGAFAPPRAVLVDNTFLSTLPWRDWISGAAEAWKVAIIRDLAFFDELCGLAPRLAARDEEAMRRVVLRSAEIHIEHIRAGGDAFESGSSRPLDFGHWVGHRLEDMTGYRLRHGEAVAVGMAVDLIIAERNGLIDAVARDRAVRGIAASGLAIWDDALKARDSTGTLEVLAGLDRFREHLGGELTLAMPAPLGAKTDIHEVAPEAVEAALAALKEMAHECASARRT